MQQNFRCSVFSGCQNAALLYYLLQNLASIELSVHKIYSRIHFKVNEKYMRTDHSTASISSNVMSSTSAHTYKIAISLSVNSRLRALYSVIALLSFIGLKLRFQTMFWLSQLFIKTQTNLRCLSKSFKLGQKCIFWCDSIYLHNDLEKDISLAG